MKPVKKSTKIAMRARQATALACCLSGVGFMAAARPVAAQAQNLTIGIVDEARVVKGFKRWDQAMSKLDQWAQGLDNQLTARAMLEGAESDRFDQLVVRDNRAKADEDALQALVKTGQDRRAEFIRLSGNASRSEAENARMKKLQEITTANQTKLRTLSDTLYNSVKKRNEDLEKQYEAEANTVVGQVATEKKLSLVLRRGAILWSAPAIDITDEVLARLNK